MVERIPFDTIRRNNVLEVGKGSGLPRKPSHKVKRKFNSLFQSQFIPRGEFLVPVNQRF